MLSKLSIEYYSKLSVAHWLAQQLPEDLMTGVKVPSSCKQPHGWEAFLMGLGLQPFELVTGSKGKAHRKVTPAKARASAQWMQPPQLGLLRLDTDALRQVLRSGVAAAASS